MFVKLLYFFLLKKTWVFKYIKNSNFWLQKNVQRPCLKWLDMLYLLCMLLVKKSEKNGGKQNRQKNGRNYFFIKNKECSTSSHLRQGLCTLFWSLLFKIMMHIEIYNVCQIIIFFLLKKTQVFKYIKNSNLWLQKNVQRPCLKWLDMLHCYVCCLKKKSEKNKQRKTK